MRVGIVGQKWFAAELLARLAPRVDVAFAAFPTPGDRLAEAAEAMGVRRFDHGEAPLEQLDPGGRLDLLIAAHAHVRIPAALAAHAAWAVGYHPSLLPLYPGRRAIELAVRAGDKVTGGTVYRLEDRFDAGAVLMQDWCFIQPGEDPAALWRRALAPMGLRLLGNLVDGLAAGRAPVPSTQAEVLGRC